ncbi:MAG: DUF6265 family protein [Cyclobacteriaceae bacterium]
MKSKLLVFLCVLFYSQMTLGQDHATNTLQFTEGQESPKASLSDISWISGHWRGEAFGGITEEIWSDPLGNSMMCVFKSVIDGKVKFYELVTVTEENQTLMLRLKHFHSDLKGWEEKDVTVDFRLVKVTEDRVYFEAFTFERVSDDEINMYVVIGAKGKQTETRFNYKRWKSF